MSASNLTPAERTLRARQAALTIWADCPDRTARTAAMRAGLVAKFERQVDPDGVLPPEERTKRVEMARKAQQARASLAAARARRERKTVGTKWTAR